jgi:hypothetical protein
MARGRVMQQQQPLQQQHTATAHTLLLVWMRQRVQRLWA